MVDLNRYQQLASSGAISEQTLTNQQATVDGNQSSYEDAEALLQKAQENLDDTIIRAPISGKLSVDDVPAGTYATAGNTALVSVGSINPVYVQFSISENEFLNFRMSDTKPDEGEGHQPPTASLTLSNGKKYSGTSTTYNFDREVSDSTGTITAKAIFDNADGILLPGMFARLTMTGQPLKDAILVPQRAVQQVLNKTFVVVVGSDNKSVSRMVTLGEQIGSYYIVESGLDKDDVVVVEGLTNLKEGQDLDVAMTTPDELGLSMTASDSSSASSRSLPTHSEACHVQFFHPAACLCHRHFHHYRHSGDDFPVVSANCPISPDFSADSQPEYDLYRGQRDDCQPNCRPSHRRPAQGCRRYVLYVFHLE